MDTISAAATLACYAEIEDRRLAPQEILTLLREIGEGRGVGRELGAGSMRYADARGHPECSMTVKSQELPAYDPRGSYGMAMAYAVSTRGACHLRAYPVSHEILRKPVVTDRFTFSGKARIIKISEDANAIADSLTACKFIFFAASLEEYALALSGVTGVGFTARDLSLAGERICYNERMMNARNGFERQDDRLPSRFFDMPGSSGEGIDVPPIDRDAFEEALSNYYIVRGLDPTGKPTAERARELQLEL
jgi:aldehyde:ferredoxin oxidoreductase